MVMNATNRIWKWVTIKNKWKFNLSEIPTSSNWRKEDVDSVIDLVRNIGEIIVKEPQDTFWGGYHA